MSFEAMLNHKCDIYHIQKKDESPGYNLPSSPSFSYPDAPDITDMQCHFGVDGGIRNIIQSEPKANYEAKIKLTLPIGTDIRLNDKIIDKETNYEYTADIPIRVRDNHIHVIVTRKSAQEAL